MKSKMNVKRVGVNALTNKKGVKMTEKWLDLYVDGRRMNRVIRFLETKFNKEQDVDKLIKLANSICYLTAQKITIVEKVTGLSDFIAKMKKKEGIE